MSFSLQWLMKQYEQLFLKLIDVITSYNGRFNENFTVSLYLGSVVAANLVAPVDGLYTVMNDAAGAVATNVIVVCTATVSEPLLGLPTATMKEDESNYLGINNLELLLQWNDI